MADDGRRFRCAGCGAKLKLPPEIDPTQARCPRCGQGLDVRTASGFNKGTNLGPYQILRPIGKGAMGTVYECAGGDPPGQRKAIKVMKREIAQRSSLLARFQREGRVGMQISHPNVVATFDAGEDQGLYYMVMEFIDGLSLADNVKRDGALSWRRGLRFTRQIASALVLMGEKNIIHRDIKPQNIMIAPDDTAKLADFGLSKIIGGEEKQAEYVDLTMTGTKMGTPVYMPPEQIEDASRATATADIYSLGATMFFLVTGRRPFEDKGAVRIMQKVLNEPAPRASDYNADVPAGIDELLLWCMAKDSYDRPASAEVLLETCKQLAVAPENADIVLSQRAVIAAERERAERARIKAERGGGGRLIMILLVLMILLGVAVALYWFVLREQYPIPFIEDLIGGQAAEQGAAE